MDRSGLLDLPLSINEYDGAGAYGQVPCMQGNRANIEASETIVLRRTFTSILAAVRGTKMPTYSMPVSEIASEVGLGTTTSARKRSKRWT